MFVLGILVGILLSYLGIFLTVLYAIAGSGAGILSEVVDGLCWPAVLWDLLHVERMHRERKYL